MWRYCYHFITDETGFPEVCKSLEMKVRENLDCLSQLIAEEGSEYQNSDENSGYEGSIAEF